MALYSSGMASSMGRSLRMVMDSYLPAIQAIYKNRGDDATLALKNTIVPYMIVIASNSQNFRRYVY